jgi:hypothetical protein
MPCAALSFPFDAAVHVVLDDFGAAGRAYRETAESDADFASIVSDH